jgi:hypothetical protein
VNLPFPIHIEKELLWNIFHFFTLYKNKSSKLLKPLGLAKKIIYLHGKQKVISDYRSL